MSTAIGLHTFHVSSFEVLYSVPNVDLESFQTFKSDEAHMRPFFCVNAS